MLLGHLAVTVVGDEYRWLACQLRPHDVRELVEIVRVEKDGPGAYQPV
jgi:hypothetical protein